MEAIVVQGGREGVRSRRDSTPSTIQVAAPVTGRGLGDYVDGVLPYAFLRPVHLKCPHCGRQETRLRASAVPGARHVCPYCKKSYAIPVKSGRSTPKN